MLDGSFIHFCRRREAENIVEILDDDVRRKQRRWSSKRQMEPLDDLSIALTFLARSGAPGGCDLLFQEDVADDSGRSFALSYLPRPN